MRAFILCVSLSFLALPSSHASTGPVPAKTLRIAAASSLQKSLRDIEHSYPDATLQFSFGASGALEQQLINGANFDIFIGAARRHLDHLAQKNLILEGSRRDLLGNTLVLVANKSKKLPLRDFRDLKSITSGKIAVGEPSSVPVGQYGQEILEALGIWNQLKANLVFGSSARQVLSFVESGNVLAGIVYATDALDAPSLEILATADPSLHSPVVYPLAIVRTSHELQAAEDFVRYLEGSLAHKIFLRHGFSIPGTKAL
ncbi:MAG: molybdate ABC transporter substrate-binding protein [Proteobacteria bacterium]|nr:molybdate ABC transporter substrate-binding protein [Pseudomonadota bacterium]